MKSHSALVCRHCMFLVLTLAPSVRPAISWLSLTALYEARQGTDTMAQQLLLPPSREECIILNLDPKYTPFDAYDHINF